LQVAICADDYALTPRVSAAILELVAARRISAVSCMTQSPYWPEHGAALKPFADAVDVGLHLTLVDEKPLTAMPLMAPNRKLPSISQLIVKSFAGQLALDEIAGEIDAQIAAFVVVMGRPPAHIDGHLHAHVLRGIRDVVFAAAERMTPRPWLRTVTDRGVFSRPSALKASILNALGNHFSREARARGFATNDGFSGFYDFAHGNYADQFPAFLRAAGPRHLILCHPGAADDDAAWSQSRAEETAYLKSPNFEALLPRAQIVRLSTL
jgi:chitin disaccharide deacetylase